MSAFQDADKSKRGVIYSPMEIQRSLARWENEGGAVPGQRRLSKRDSRKALEAWNIKATTLRRILVPIDFSPESLRTLRYAKLLGKRFGAKLHLVHVVTPPRKFPARRATLPWAFSEREVAANAKKRLKSLAAEFSLPPRPNPCAVRVGAIWDEINEVARATSTDLIAIATRGYTGFKHAFLGSTTERVVRNAPCPVLVVRDKEHESAKERARRGRTPLQFRKILVPVDFSECSHLGLEYALSFAQEFRASLVLFHSVFVNSYALGDKYTALEVPNFIATQQDYAKDEMEKLRRWVSKRGRQVETEIAFGSPVEQIGDYIAKENIDLIITSTHGRSGLRRVFIGSTAERIVRHATCPVMVVPNRTAWTKASKATTDFKDGTNKRNRS